MEFSALKVTLYVKNDVSVLKTLLNSVRIGFKFVVVCSLCMSRSYLDLLHKFIDL